MSAQQPAAQAPMSTNGPSKEAKTAAGGAAGEGREWKHSAFKCENTDLCCWTHCCPCFAYSEERSRLKHLEENEKRPVRKFGVDSVIWCAGFWFCLYWIPQMATRARVRQRYGIKGGVCGDFCMTVCCPCPAIMQEMEEINDEEEGLTQGKGDGELRLL